MRAKVVKKLGDERDVFYGRVGTVLAVKRCFPDCNNVLLLFGDGNRIEFKESELRMRVKTSG